MDKFQTKGLIILVLIIFGAEVFIAIARDILLEEAGKVFQVFLWVSFKIAMHNDNVPSSRGYGQCRKRIPKHGVLPNRYCID